MTRREAWRLIGRAAMQLLACGGAQAGKQAKVQALWLGSGNWQLRVVKGEPCLVEHKLDRQLMPPKENRDWWYVSAPTIEALPCALAYKLKGKEPSVSVAK